MSTGGKREIRRGQGVTAVYVRPARNVPRVLKSVLRRLDDPPGARRFPKGPVNFSERHSGANATRNEPRRRRGHKRQDENERTVRDKKPARPLSGLLKRGQGDPGSFSNTSLTTPAGR